MFFQEIELTQKKIECETLAEEIKKEKQRNKELVSAEKSPTNYQFSILKYFGPSIAPFY